MATRTTETKPAAEKGQSWHRLEDRYLRAGEVRTRYWQEGSEGSNLVLLHGLGSYLNSWCLNIGRFATHHRVYAPDLLGHGYTDKPQISYSLDCFVTFLGDFLSALGLARTHLLGHSWGGAVALRFAGLYPERVDRLVLAGSSGLGPDVSLWLRLLTLPYFNTSAARVGRKVLKIASRTVIVRPEKRTSEWIGMTQERMRISEVRAVVRAVTRHHLSLRGLRPEVMGMIRTQLPSLRVPTLVIHGRNDWLIPPSNVAFAKTLNPRLEVKLLERCGHELQYECAEEFNEAVLEFLSR
jgi:4,5:9,10-diseco-3-hydroxy-5,9,17-trioxoandrosta-1(10),2-diene-4-oate hydrolase